MLSTDCSWRRDASIQPSFRSRRSFFGKVMRKTRFRKFAVGSTILFKKKRSEIDICTRIVNCARVDSRFRSYRTVRSGASANFRTLYRKISHETNKQWKSSYKSPRCSLDLGEEVNPTSRHSHPRHSCLVL
jgi:hypothetical protein